MGWATPGPERPSNGMHVAALVCGILGVLAGLIPLFFLPAWGFGGVAAVLGYLAYKRAKPHGIKQGRAGMALGSIAIVLGFVGVAIVADAFDDVDDELNSIESGTPPASTERSSTTELDQATDGSPPAVDDPTTTTTEADIAQIGPDDWFTWDDGVEAQVTSIEQFTPEYDSTPGPDVVATVTIRNGTDATIDAMMSTANLYAGPNGAQAEEEYSFYGFEGSIPPGQTATAKWAWTVPQEHLGQLRVEFSPSYEHDPAFFEGSAA